MPTNGDMSAAITSRSFEEGSGEQMRKHLAEQRATPAREKLVESVEGRQFVESVRGVHERLTKLLATAPAGTIATRIRRQLEDLRDSMNV